jgi:hypothetical protein
MPIGAGDMEPNAAGYHRMLRVSNQRAVQAKARLRGGYPVSFGSLAFSHPAMPSGITKTSA